jgi:hypothetical protein
MKEKKRKTLQKQLEDEGVVFGDFKARMKRMGRKK